jgi:hypothetical protein
LKNSYSFLVIAIVLLIPLSIVVLTVDNIFSVHAKPLSSHGHSKSTKIGKPGGPKPSITGDGFSVQPPPGTEPLANITANNSPYALAIAHRLATTSINASKTQERLGTPCLPELNRFILPLKEHRFTVIKQCVTVIGRVVWTHYFNDDGDANFNVVLDPSYKNMLGPGSYSQVFANKYPGGPALHIEVVCQGPVTSLTKENVGACNGYSGPNFKSVLPKIGQRVMVTGRYLIEMPEMPGGITELHPVYEIKIIPQIH